MPIEFNGELVRMSAFDAFQWNLIAEGINCPQQNYSPIPIMKRATLAEVALNERWKRRLIERNDQEVK